MMVEKNLKFKFPFVCQIEFDQVVTREVYSRKGPSAHFSSAGPNVVCPVSLIWAFFNSNLPKKLKVEIRKNNIFIDAHIPSWAALNIQREIHSKDLISQNDLTSSFDRFCFVLEIVFLFNFQISY